MERAQESVVWRYFTLATPTSLMAVCNVCKVNVSKVGGSTAKYNTASLIKHIQKHHAKEHAEFLQLNKTKGAGDRTAQPLTLADALQRHEKFLTKKLKSIGNNTESFRIHCFRRSANVSCWRWGLPSPTGIFRAKVLSFIMQVCFRDRYTVYY